MNTTPEVQRQESDDSAESALALPSGGSRRFLLGGAVGGFTLAASGLVLPEWLIEEAEADNHSVRRVQNRKERKREKHRNELERRRKQNRRRGGAPAAPRAIIKGVRMVVFAEYYGPLYVKFYYTTVGLPDSTATFGIPEGADKDYGTPALNLEAYFEVGPGTPPAPAKGNLKVYATNPVGTPDVTVRNGYNNTVIQGRNLKEEESIDLNVDIYLGVRVKLNIRRNTDSDDFKEFTLNVGPRV